MSEWKEYKIEELGRVVTGKTPRTSIPDNYGGDIPFLSPSDDMQSKYVPTTARYLTQKGLLEVKNCLLPKGAICVSCIGSDMGKSVITEREVVTNQQINSIIPNPSFDSHFVYYLMQSKRREIKFMGGNGTAVPILNKSSFANLTVLAPNIEEQKNISSFLSSLDDKIAVNRKICENLEAQAQALFKHWFIDFAPFKNGKFVESELGMIPEGWKVGTLSDLGDIICGKTPSKANKLHYGGNVPFIKIPDMHGNMFVLNSEDNLSNEGSNSQLNKLIPEFSIMVSCIATVGLVSMNTKPSHTNQQINTIVPYVPSYRYYLYENLKLREKELLMLGSSGTTTYNLNTKVFSSLKIMIPELKVIEDFDKSIKYHFEETLNLYQENLRLSTLRDTLLPKLMKGEIEV